MNRDMQDLINGYLDGMLDEAQKQELNAWVKAIPENAATFCAVARLHDRLHGVIRMKQADQVTPEKPASKVLFERQSHRRHSLRPAGLVGGFAALVAVVLLAVWSSYPRPVNAATELDRLITTDAYTHDRSYLIHDLDAKPELADEGRPPIDGAALYVRRPEQYVLIRRFPDGRLLTTGSDGERSWSVRPDGAVRVSADPMRFRGPLPGNQHGIPFVDLRSDLVELRDAYVVTVLPPLANGWRGLLAEKKSHEYRGPRRVELWYDANTGLIHRMVFAGMPRGRGGPNSVAVELQDQRDLGADFFRHESHHGPERRVIEEE